MSSLCNGFEYISIHQGKRPLFIVDATTGKLQCMKLEERQVKHASIAPWLTCYLPCFAISHKTYDQNCLLGSAIAIQDPEDDTWSLGIFLSCEVLYHNMSAKVTFARWKGSTMEERHPRFVELTGHDWEEGGYAEEFETVQWYLEKRDTLYFLSQVSGPRHGGRNLHENHVDEHSKCAQASVEEPDELLCLNLFDKDKRKSQPDDRLEDNHATGRARKIPRLDRNVLPFCCASEASYRPQRSSILFVPSTSSRKKPKSKDFWIPYATQSSATKSHRFAVVTKKTLRKLLSSKQTFTPDDFDDELEKVQVRVESLRVLDLEELPYGVRIAMLPPERSGTAHEFNFIEDFTGTNLELPYGAVPVSIWFPVDDPVEVTEDDADLLFKAFGLGYANRGRTDCVGQNNYIGKRTSLGARVDPCLGKAAARKAQFHRRYYDHRFIPAVSPLANKMVSHATMRALEADPNLYHAIAEAKGIEPRVMADDTGICALKIITQGLPRRVIGFGCEDHLDEQDQLSKEEIERILEQAEACIATGDTVGKSVGEYLRRVYRCFGGSFGLPTTCEYVHVGDIERLNDGETSPSRSPVDLLSYFVFPHLDVAVKFGKNCGHMFFGSVASHCTVVPIAIANGYVKLKCDKFRILAWGKSIINPTPLPYPACLSLLISLTPQPTTQARAQMHNTIQASSLSPIQARNAAIIIASTNYVHYVVVCEMRSQRGPNTSYVQIRPSPSDSRLHRTEGVLYGHSL